MTSQRTDQGYNLAMNVDALLAKVEGHRLAKADFLEVQVTFLDLKQGTFRGQVTSSAGDTVYEARLDLKKRTCHCECQDFSQRLKPCKHLAALALRVKQITFRSSQQRSI